MKLIKKKLTPLGELRLARKELKKYLSMCKEETIIGGIRNLAQCYVTWKEIANERETKIIRLIEEIDHLRDRNAYLEAEVRFGVYN